MSRRLIWGLVAALVLVSLFGSWLATHLEREPAQTREPPRAEARRNPYLALERFTARMGGTLTRVSDAKVLDRLPPGGTVFLDRQRLAWLPAERLQGLLTWVEAGGYLIAVAEEPGIEDRLLDHLGIKRLGKGERAGRGPERVVELALPGASSPTLLVDATGHVLEAGGRRPAWSAGRVGHGAQLLHYQIGLGQVTVAAGLDAQWSNHRIGARDHAELYWALLSRYDRSPQPRVLLLSRLQMPTLLTWIWESAWAACLAAASLLALWLWRIVPRFGACLPEAPPTRRELREHLSAVGRYLWRCSALSALLVPAREHFQSRLSLRQPSIAALPRAEQPAALAALTRRPIEQIAAALNGSADTPPTFTDALRTLYKLEREL